MRFLTEKKTRMSSSRQNAALKLRYPFNLNRLRLPIEPPMLGNCDSSVSYTVVTQSDKKFYAAGHSLSTGNKGADCKKKQ